MVLVHFWAQFSPLPPKKNKNIAKNQIFFPRNYVLMSGIGGEWLIYNRVWEGAQGMGTIL